MQELGDDAVRHLQALIRIDTTNPPGNETPAAEYLAELLTQSGLQPQLIGETPKRQNVIARLKGNGSKAPLLLAAHLDVVEAEPESWKHPPFSGEIHDGYIWGRGAIDMKHMAVMCALVIARLKREGLALERDLIFAGVADEEAGCDHGSRWLVDNHPDLVRAEFSLGEAGGFSVRMNGRVIYPIQVAEKGTVWMKLRATGRPGHGSMPRENNAVAKIGAAIAKIAATKLPPHKTAVVERYLRAIAATQKFPASMLLPKLHNRAVANFLLSKVPDRGVAAALAATLSNTAVPTVLRAGAKTNVIPGFAEAWVDGRSLPGQSAQDLVREIKDVIGHDIEIDVERDMPPVEIDPQSPLWDLMVAALKKHDPEGVPVPYLAPGFSDAKSWSRLGTRCYGFMPVRFPDDGVRFADLFHGHDERIPVEGLRWGVQVLYDVVRAFVTGATELPTS
ncbi:MAG TPA: M20/M25/M40 family metallo-hydrolase [Polyangia bacterium]|nr:M20/M25/M40 family metallo-hydrolase [Polyangia bacterium]